MAGEIKFTVDDREFQRTLRAYARQSRRDAADIVNRKALFVSLRAIKETPKADKLAIGKELSALIFDFKQTAKGYIRKLKTATRFGRFGQTHEVPIVALLINAQRGRQGKKGLYGDAMKQAVQKFISARQRTVAFLRSGWLPAVKVLSPLVRNKSGAPKVDSETMHRRPGAGGAIAASEGWRVKATIHNAIAAGGKDAQHHAQGVERYGVPALQRALKLEEQDMRQFMEDKARESARKLGIRTN